MVTVPAKARTLFKNGGTNESRWTTKLDFESFTRSGLLADGMCPVETWGQGRGNTETGGCIAIKEAVEDRPLHYPVCSAGITGL